MLYIVALMLCLPGKECRMTNFWIHPVNELGTFATCIALQGTVQKHEKRAAWALVPVMSKQLAEPMLIPLAIKDVCEIPK